MYCANKTIGVALIVLFFNSLKAQPLLSKEKKLCFSFEGGYSRFLYNDDDIDPLLQSYADAIKDGYHLGGQLTYFLTDRFGISLGTKFYRTTAASDSLLFIFPNTTIPGVISDNISVWETYIALISGFEIDPVYLYFYLGAGQFYYQNEVTYIIQRAEIRDVTPAFRFGLGLEFPNSENLAWFVKAEFVTAVLSDPVITYKPPVTLGSVEEESRLSRIDISVGLQYSIRLKKKRKAKQRSLPKDKRMPGRFE